MLKVISTALCVALVILLVSCKRSVDAAGYIRYIADKQNGITKSTEIDGFEYRIQYRTPEHIALAEGNGNIKKGDVEKRKANLKGSVWFNISLKRTDNAITILKYGVNSLDQYNTRLNYYLNGASKDIKLFYGTETLHPSSYLFENNYNLTPQETMVVGFTLPAGNDHPVKDMRLSLFDRVFQNGIINASFPIKTIDKIPTLTY